MSLYFPMLCLVHKPLALVVLILGVVFAEACVLGLTITDLWFRWQYGTDTLLGFTNRTVTDDGSISSGPMIALFPDIDGCRSNRDPCVLQDLALRGHQADREARTRGERG